MRVATRTSFQALDGLSENLFGLGQKNIVAGIELTGGQILGADKKPVPGAKVIVRADGKVVKEFDASGGGIPAFEKVEFPSPTSNWTATIEAPGKTTIEADTCNTGFRTQHGTAWTAMYCVQMEPSYLLAPGEVAPVAVTREPTGTFMKDLPWGGISIGLIGALIGAGLTYALLRKS
jgi:hypothetical protein